MFGRPCGQLVKASTLLFKKKKDVAIRIQGGASSGNSRLFERGFNFQAMGIGGLDKEFADIFRRAFARPRCCARWASSTCVACCCTARPAAARR